MTGARPDPESIIIIKKYANRRLYNTDSSSYITLEHLAAMTREGRDFKVVDAKSGEDITHNVLTQIIMEEENRGQNMLPVNFLRQLISMYGDSMQAMVPQYLEASMDAFQRNQAQFREAMTDAFSGGPFETIARRNMDMFEAATRAFTAPASSMNPAANKPSRKPQAAESTGTAAKNTETDEPAASAAMGRDELDDLKAQLASMQAQLNKLTR